MLYVYTGLSSNVEYEVFVTSETNITSQIPTTNVTLLARGDSVSYTSTDSMTSSTTLSKFTVPQNTELIVAIVAFVLIVVAIVIVVIVIVICIALFKYRL